MNIEELRALFSDMLSKDIRPLLCDTAIPKYDTAVPCGEPNMCHEDIIENELFPNELLSMHPEFIVPVKGDSMKDAGIVTGDMVKVIGDVMPGDGDIVLACIDGEYTLKTYFEDEEGQPWLVPQNEKYTPIPLSSCGFVKIIGRVLEIVKKAPRVASRECMKAIKKVKMSQEKTHVLSQQKISFAIREVSTMVKTARQWYAVYRVLADRNVVREGDFEGFCKMIREEVPKHEHLPARDELQRLASLSFTKPVTSWRADNAPVQGKRFTDYLRIAQKMKELLEQKTT